MFMLADSPPGAIRKRFLWPALAGLVGLAWLALGVWGSSPYAALLGHRELAQLDLYNPGVAALFIAGWALMVVAMMLPTSLPLLALFRGLTAAREDSDMLIALVVAGYLATWTAFGAAAHFADWNLHRAVTRLPWLQVHAWLIGAGTLALAGAYQLTPLKYACLERFRSPFSFITEHWQGRRERLRALRLGLDHGLFCVGCCWSLMLVMFALGAANLGWMLVLGAAMAVEKNLGWRWWPSLPLGLLLMGWSLAIVLGNLPPLQLLRIL